MKTRAAAVMVVPWFFLVACSPGTSEIPGYTDDSPPAEEPLLAVDAYMVETGVLFDPVEASGTTAAVREVTLVSETQGVVREKHFDLGTEVEAGQILLRFDNRAETAAVREAEQRLEAARVKAETVERRYGQGSISRVEAAGAIADAAGARNVYEQARRRLEQRTIRSPIGGVVADYSDAAREGNLLTVGSMVARVVHTSRLQMRVGVGQNAITRISTGDTAEVVLPSVRQDPYPATVRSIGAAADPATGSFPVIVEWDNPPDTPALPGMSGFVRLTDLHQHQGVIIPAGALTDSGEGAEQDTAVVFTVRDGRANRRQVTVAARRGPRVLLEQGLDPGDMIIASALSRLEHGTPVRARVLGNSTDIR